MKTPRQKALAALGRIIGPEAIPSFLKARQPAWGDATGAELLERQPLELLRRLEQLEHDRELAAIGEGACYD